MQYLIIALFVLPAVFLFHKLVLPLSEPDFRLKGQLSQDKLNDTVREMAYRSRHAVMRGKGLSLRLIRKYINRAYKNIAGRIRRGEECFEFENRIYDNFYKLTEVMSSLKKELHKFVFLPHIDELPKIYDLMQTVVKSCDGCVTEEIIRGVTDSYNNENPLRFNEITAMKPALEYALLEFIAIFASKSLIIDRTVRRARLDASRGRVDLTRLRYNSYAYSFSRYGSAAAKQSVAALCLENGIDLESRGDNFVFMTARYNARMESAFTSLHSTVKIFTDEFTLSLSAVYDLLSGESGVCFKEVSAATKFLYLERIFILAKRRRVSESMLARDAVLRAERQKTDIASELLPPPKGAVFSCLYILTQVLAVIAASVFSSFFFFKGFPAAGVVCAPVFFALAHILIGSFFKSFAQRRQMPLFDTKLLDRTKCLTLITVCRLVADEEEMRDAFERLNTILYANPSGVFSYCLLIDLPAAMDENGNKNDAQILSAADSLYESNPHKERITVLVRNRRRTRDGQRFRGWERKRGAVLELNDYLLGGGADAFMLKKGGAENIKYVLILDSDTLTNGALNLVSMMEHPYNSDKTIIGVNMHTGAEEAMKTRFSKLFSGGRGLDNYSGYIAQPEYDLFGSGNYTGKGIYRVREFQEKLKGAFLDETILSHDYIEGAFVSCANSNETALDSFPQGFSQFLSRQLRWLRGDWQLLPYLKRRIKNSVGEKVKNPIMPINKWHILANMLSSLVPVASLILLFLSIISPQPFKLIGAAFLLPAIYTLLSIRTSVLLNRNLFLPELIRQLFWIAVLPVVGYGYAKSIIITIGRLIRRKKLLEWTVAAHSKGRISFVPSYLSVIIFVASAVVLSLNPFYYALSGFFLLAPFADLFLSSVIKERRYQSEEFDASLKDIFTSTYEYFKENLKEKYNYLPCDNFQTDLGKDGEIARTSPTNIGFALIAHICAYEIKLIERDALTGILDKIISATERLEKWKGNLYNWYGIETLKKLRPGYVSSVDSGNFTACLIATLAYTDGTLKKRIEKLINETDLAALFDVKRGLYRIGYNSDTGAFDQNHYDLAASESSILYLVSAALGRTDKYAWNNLLRKTVKYGGATTLYSWTGGMFEHLMCPLFFRYSGGTLFKESARGAVRAQKRFAKVQRLKFFGVSECQYPVRDDNGLYRYKAFGVPDIALKNYEGGSVAAPYASFLALGVDDKAVHKNLSALETAGMKGRYGFFESADFASDKIMQTYMTHHQGMILAAICNRLTDNSLIRAMRNHPGIRAADMLLSQPPVRNGGRKLRIAEPRKISVMKGRTIDKRLSVPQVNLLSHGRYNAVFNSCGGGYSLYCGTLLTRYDNRADGIKLIAELNGRQSVLTDGVFEFNPENCIIRNKTIQYESSVETLLLPCAGEARIVSFTNTTDKPQKVRFISYCEPVLTDRNADIAHRAYSNMFIKSGCAEMGGYVWATRTNAKKPLYLAHFVKTDAPVSYTSSRLNYYRKTSFADFGTPLDPVLASHFELEIAPKTTFKYTVFHFAGSSTDVLDETVRLCRTAGYCERARGCNYALAQAADISPQLKRTAAILLYGSTGTRKRAESDESYSRRPIIAVKLSGIESVARLKQRLSQLKKLYAFNIEFNLAVVYREKHNYYLKLSEAVNAAMDELSFRKSLNFGSTVRLINEEESPLKAEYALSNSVTDDTSLIYEIDGNASIPKKAKYPNAEMPKTKIALASGIGGFTDDGSFFMDISDTDTPAPWSNIVANREFGTIITESGGGYTYYQNSRQSKLTRWSNDASLDPPSEFIVLGEKGVLWSVTKKPLKTNSNYTVLHSFGYSEFTNNYNGILSVLRVFIDKDEPVKYYELTLKNEGGQRRSIDIMLAFDPVLGDFKHNTAIGIDVKKEGGTLVVKNNLNNLKMYVKTDGRIESYGAYRESFTDSHGSITKNTGLKQDGSELFPSVSVRAEIESGGTQRVIFTLGADPDADCAKAGEALRQTAGYYSSLPSVSVLDPQNSVYGYMAKWLPYQTLCSRFYARAGFYQAGGAIGFRDQMQDCLSVLYVNPKLVREHILTAAAHQFEAGDVQHWWHPPAIGVRTTISDDRLFLPFVTAEYIAFTQDFSILSERAPYLENVRLSAGESSAYVSAQFTARGDTLLNHCLRALFVSMDFGENGLSKMRGGDWNDAMDKVGERGVGTSVWLTMFLYMTCANFLPYVNTSGDRVKIIGAMERIKKAVDKAFDGEWFIRAFTDDGIALGSADSPECKIDILSQGFAVLSGACDAEKCDIALKSAERELVDRDERLIKLLKPPFKHTKNIGYISNYPEGVRENGGQYTHAAVWYIMALVRRGEAEKAWELFEMLTPFYLSDTPQKAERYALEPYVLAADVYSGEFGGRGGWSWYTGAAAWFYKCLIEEFYGIKIRHGKLIIEPSLPSKTRKVTLKLRVANSSADIIIDNSKQKGRWIIKVNNISYGTNEIDYNDSLEGKKITVFKEAD